MSEMVRFGVSMKKGLLKNFDRLIAERGYRNRSEAIRDLIRESLIRAEWTLVNKETIGTITIVYSHKVRELSDTITALQHKFYKQIISTTHIHLDAHNCLEVLIVRGRGKEIKKIADHLLSTRGVKHGKLVTTTTGKRIE